MSVYVGTSGFSYREWKGHFYPSDLPSRGFLEYYAARLSSVEINGTFYRLPQASVLAGWGRSVSAGFRFAVKAPQSVTHRGGLNASALPRFLELLPALTSSLGPVLFQLPPTRRADAGELREFLQGLPSEMAFAFEFRHPSWFCDEILAELEAGGAALVGGDVDDEAKSPPLERTAPFAYVRLRKSDYGPGELERWAARLAALEARDLYVYFKHEVGAPDHALHLGKLLAATAS